MRTTPHGSPRAFRVTGRYCPTDANPETDAAEVETTEKARTIKEARVLLLWYPGGRIEKV